jgi:hypothetical protein
LRRDRELNPFEALFRAGDRIVFIAIFVWRRMARNEEHAFEIERLTNFFCCPEMTQMNGVERASEEPNSSGVHWKSR